MTLAEAALLTGAVLEGEPDRLITGVAPADEAGPADVCLVDWTEGHDRDTCLVATKAAAAIVAPDYRAPRPGINLLRVPGPHQAFLVLGLELWRRYHVLPPGVDPSAHIDPLTRLGDDVHVGPHCVLGAGAGIGPRAVLHPGVVVSPWAEVGESTILHARVFVGPSVRIGRNCIIHPGAVIGFSYRPYPVGADAPVKPPSAGGVVIEDNVEIGPNSVVETGESRPTRIGRGAKIGALVMVGHDCVIGPRAELVSMVGLAGGAEVGPAALLLGQVGVAGRAHVGERSVVLAQSGVTKDVPPGVEYMGCPARPRLQWLRAQAAVSGLPGWIKRVSALERKVAKLTSGGESPTEKR